MLLFFSSYLKAELLREKKLVTSAEITSTPTHEKQEYEVTTELGLIQLSLLKLRILYSTCEGAKNTSSETHRQQKAVIVPLSLCCFSPYISHLWKSVSIHLVLISSERHLRNRRNREFSIKSAPNWSLKRRHEGKDFKLLVMLS